MDQFIWKTKWPWMEILRTNPWSTWNNTQKEPVVTKGEEIIIMFFSVADKYLEKEWMWTLMTILTFIESHILYL